MANWFERAFGAAIDEVGSAVADIRTKLIDEAWFGRRAGASSEHHHSHQHEAGGRNIQGNGQSAIDQLFARDPGQCVTPSERDTHGNAHDIER